MNRITVCMIGALTIGLVAIACKETPTESVATAPAKSEPDCLPTNGQPFWGVCYGPYRKGEQPNSANLTPERLDDDFSRVAKLASVVRTYGLGDGQEKIIAAAHKSGMSVWLGAWLGSDEAANKVEMDRLKACANEPGVVGVCLGNEDLVRGDLSIDDLESLLKEGRTLIGGKTLAYADTPDMLVANSQRLAPLIDVVFVNIHPYWDGVDVNAAVAKLWSRYAEVQAAYPGRQVVISETGWPSAGGPKDAAKAGATEQAVFIKGLKASLVEHPHTGVMFFEAFDETWKSENGVGGAWGVMDECGATKKALVQEVPVLERDKSRCPEILPRVVLTKGALGPGLGMGVDRSDHVEGWVKHIGDSLVCKYPGELGWGAVFIVAGLVEEDNDKRKSLDLTAYELLEVELKADVADAKVSIGLKTPNDPDTGTEPKETVEKIGTAWRTVRIPLSHFSYNQTRDEVRLKKIYVVLEVVFEPDAPKETVYVRNARFLPKE